MIVTQTMDAGFLSYGIEQLSILAYVVNWFVEYLLVIF